MPKASTLPVPCPTCEAGHIRPANLLGRRFNYRGAEVTIDVPIILPECDSCGDLRLGVERTAALNQILERLRTVNDHNSGSRGAREE